MTVKQKISELVIGATTLVRGKLVGDEDLLILGRLEGELDLGRGELRVERSGVVIADVRAAEAQIAGVVIGRVEVAGRLGLTSTARVVGDIAAGRITVEAGAQVRGEVQAGEALAGGAWAPSGAFDWHPALAVESLAPLPLAGEAPTQWARPSEASPATTEAQERRRVSVRVKRREP